MTVVQLADGVFRVPTVAGDLVNSFVLCGDDSSVTVVDAGFKRGGRRVRTALQALGKNPQEVTHLLLTHAHMDHAGGVSAVRASQAQVLAHTDDVGWLAQGREPHSDPGSLGGRLVNLVGQVWRRPWFSPVIVDRALSDGETLPIAGGVKVIHTPGHTPGHVALLHESSGVLITGDAVMNVRGLRRAPRFFCADLRQEDETRRRLVEVDFDLAAFTHGTEVRKNARSLVEQFIASDPRNRAR